MQITTQQVLYINSAIFSLLRNRVSLNKYLAYRLAVLGDKVATHVDAYNASIEAASEEDKKRILNEKVDLGKTEPIMLKDLPDEVTMDIVMNLQKSGLLKE